MNFKINKNLNKIVIKIIIGILVIGMVGFLASFLAGFRHANLYFYEVPWSIYDTRGAKDTRPSLLRGTATVQFETCLPKIFCVYDYVSEGDLIIFRNNNIFSNKQFGHVKAINKTTYTIELFDGGGDKIIEDIPKKWVFGRD